MKEYIAIFIIGISFGIAISIFAIILGKGISRLVEVFDIINK